MHFRLVFASAALSVALLLGGCASASDKTQGEQRQAGQYYIQSGYIYGPKESGKFYILNRYIYGPKNSGIYYLPVDYDPAKFGPFYIWGPKMGGKYYIQGNYIFGPPGDLPWLRDEQ